jgi:hypothetical protein
MMIVRFEILRVVLLRIHVFWGMIMCCYVRISDVSEYHREFTFDSFSSLQFDMLCITLNVCEFNSFYCVKSTGELLG